MKKVILILAALVLVVSGVAAVSAYEAHVVNVTAHVENALSVSATQLTIGGTAAFPEEWLEGSVTVDTSSSFKTQSRVNNVDIKLCAEPKPAGTAPGNLDYRWAGGFTFISVDGGTTWVWIGPTADEVEPTAGFTCPTMTAGTANNTAVVTVDVGMDIPVFDGFYNELTDVPNKPRPDNATCASKGVDEPCVISAGTPTGSDFGLDLKIQVVDIY